MHVMSRTKHSLTDKITPVNPSPDWPPLVVYIVTVSPICSINLPKNPAPAVFATKFTPSDGF